ncbi:MAG: hypothetical protein KatS3mg091_255 [Patescibacteria group bacterium]|nr:MAG: hypothetical protein KatS3mg091_255 [Patescibacteria group bacterium]
MIFSICFFNLVKIAKFYIWLPYLSNIKVYPKSVYFEYKGGELNIDWVRIHSVMIYGHSVDLPCDFLYKCCFYKIPVVVHRRNVSRAVFICSNLSGDSENILSRQILFRNNEKKKAYIAKKLLLAKFKSMSWLVPYRSDYLYKVFNIDEMMAFEAYHARKYWREFFRLLGVNVNRRINDSVYKKTLDAVSKFLSGIMLRWIVFHNLSPYHGFLHKPVDYPALVYDLIEPYRGFFDKVVFNVFVKFKQSGVNLDKALSASIDEIKEFLSYKVYVSATRQVVGFKELLHGIVLSLRTYLLSNTKRFIVPMPSKPKGGRPINAGYKLYGGNAGITNFWPNTKQFVKSFEEVYFNLDF